MGRSDLLKYPGLKEKFADLEKAPNSQEWVATANQDTFVITNGSYAVGSKTLEVVVDGFTQPPSAYTELSSVSFKLSEQIPAGSIVAARWFEGKVPITFNHHVTHEAGGQDELDVTKLKNYDEEIADKIIDLQNDRDQRGINISKYDHLKVPVTGGYNYSPVIQEAIREAETTKLPVLLPEYTTLKCNDGLTVDCSKVTLIGESTKLDFSDLTSGAALTVVGTVYPPYRQSMRWIQGIQLYGGNMKQNVARPTIGIKCDVNTAVGWTTGAKNAVSHIEFKNIDIEGFGQGIYEGNNSYLIKFTRVDVHHCGKGVYNPSPTDVSGITNYGENYTYDHCAFYGNDLALHLRGDSSTHYFENCSIDYNVKSGTIETSVNAIFNTCFIEHRHGDLPTTEMWTLNEFSVVEFKSCYFYLVDDGFLGSNINYYFVNNSQYYTQFNNCNFRNFRTTTGILVNGNALGHRNVFQYTSYLQLSNAGSAQLMPDLSTASGISSFHNTWVSDTATILTKDSTNDTEIVWDSSIQYGSKPTLKIKKKNAGTNQKVFISFSPSINQTASIEYYAQKLSGTTGDITVRVRYATVRDKSIEYTTGKFISIPALINQGYVSATTMLDADLATWKKYQPIKLMRLFPRYNAIVLEFDLTSLSVGGSVSIGGFLSTEM